MIKLNRPSEPPILSKNKQAWTTALLESIQTHGGYANIPEKEKECLLSNYRKQDIKDALNQSSHDKCAFCESKPGDSGNIEVEHFKPKFKYSVHAFEWDNLLPSCRKCNGRKLDHDVALEPIINPYDVDPSKMFIYKDIKMKAAPGIHYDIANKTIEVCGLDTIRLWTPRSRILIDLNSFEKALEQAISDYNNADTERKKTNKLRRIQEALETIENLAKPEEKFSHFCNSFLENSDVFNKAKEILLQNGVV